VGDVKARRLANKESFDAYEKGHLESFLEDLLLEFQPYRRAVNGFLTDGCLIQFFRLERLETRELMWTEAPVLHLDKEGDKWLLGLLQDKDAHELPADITINQKPLVMNKLLGVGGSSVVYSGVHQGEYEWAPCLLSIYLSIFLLTFTCTYTCSHCTWAIKQALKWW
jgi:hypothetical protein